MRDVNNGGKLSTNTSIGDIDIFAVCQHCSWMAVSHSSSKKINIIRIDSGLTTMTINTSCVLDRISLSGDGNKLVYLCTNGSMTLKDLNTGNSYNGGGVQTNVSYLKVMQGGIKKTNVVLVSNGAIKTVSFILY